MSYVRFPIEQFLIVKCLRKIRKEKHFDVSIIFSLIFWNYACRSPHRSGEKKLESFMESLSPGHTAHDTERYGNDTKKTARLLNSC